MRRFTPEEDVVIVEMAPTHRLIQIGAQLDRDPDAIRKRMKLLRDRGESFARLPVGRHWAPEEDEELLYLLRFHPITTVAKKLRRSEKACCLRLKKQRIHAADFRETVEEQEGLLGSEVRHLFGVDKDTVHNWNRWGLLCPSGRVGYLKSCHSQFIFEPSEIHRFIREYPDRYAVQDMAPGAFRRLAEQIQRKEAENPGLSPKQVAAMKGVTIRTVRAALSRGHLLGQRRKGTNRQWEIRKSDADAWTPNPHYHSRKLRKAA